MILADTSVWVDHLRRGNSRLASLLRDELILIHPFVLGELACGNLRNRQEILRLLSTLTQARIADHDEALHLLEAQRLYGQGLGWIDAHLLASALLTGCGLWTLDTPLARAASALSLSV